MQAQITYLEGTTLEDDLPVVVDGEPHTSFPFTVYEEATGRAIFGGTTMHMRDLAPEGCIAVAEPFVPNSYRKDGVVKLYPAQPFDGATFNHVTEMWEDGRTIEQVQADKWAEIKRTRDSLEATSFPYLGKVLDSNSRSVQRINTAVQAAQAAMLAGEPFEIAWTCFDDTVLELDVEGMIGMPAALALYGDQLHQTSRALRAQIYADDATRESIAAIAWPASATAPLP